MKIIDWYILKKYFTTFIFCLLAFTLIVVVVDLSEKTDDFAKTKLSFTTIITQYYFGFLPKIDAMLFPLFVFIAVIFFTSVMANRTEIIAILGSGVSFKRFLMPYILGGTVLSLLLWWANQNMLPKANAKWAAFVSQYIDPNYGAYQNKSFLSNYYFRLDSFSYAGIRYYDTTRKNGNNFFVQTFHNNKLTHNVRAEAITWDTTFNKWRLDKVTERFVDGIKETVKQQDSLQMAYNFKPRDLQRDDYMKDKLSTADLKDFIKIEKIRGSENVNSLELERHTRNAVPVSVLILTLIGAIVASKKIRGGSGFHLAIGIGISLLYILVGRFAAVFATKGNFNPALAAWLPNIFFGLLVYYLYRRASK